MAADPGVAASSGVAADPGAEPNLGVAATGERLGELRFLTVAEVATLMRVSKMTVYRLVNAATLPAVRVGRSVRVPEQAVHDYLQHSFVEAG
jgi:excisionase family DNA binding protein